MSKGSILIRRAYFTLFFFTLFVGISSAQTTFKDGTQRIPPSSNKTKDFVWGDFVGNNGVLDLFQAFSATTNNRVFENSSGLFSVHSLLTSAGTVITYDSDAFDANNDGLLDVLRIDNGESSFGSGISATRLFLNNGNGFDPPLLICDGGAVCLPNHNWDDAAIGDVDEDGDLDLLMSEFTQSNIQHTALYKNLTAQGQPAAFSKVRDFQTQTTCGGGTIHCPTHDVDFGDIDSDGDLDIILGNGGDSPSSDPAQNQLFENIGNLQFVEITERLPQIQDHTTFAQFADLDMDGDLDLFIGNALDPTPTISNDSWSRILINDGAGFFQDETEIRLILDPGMTDFSATETYQAGFGDLDFDGDIDFVSAVAFSTAGNLLFFNRGGREEQGVFDQQDVIADPEFGTCSRDPGIQCQTNADCQPPGNSVCEFGPPTQITGSGQRLTAELADAEGNDGDLEIIWGADNPVLLVNQDNTAFSKIFPSKAAVGGGTPFILRCVSTPTTDPPRCDKFFSEGVKVFFGDPDSFPVPPEAQNVRLLNGSTIYGVAPPLGSTQQNVQIFLRPVEQPLTKKPINTNMSFVAEGLSLNASSSDMTVFDSDSGSFVDLDPSTPTSTESEESINAIPVASAFDQAFTIQIPQVNRRTFIAGRRGPSPWSYHLFGFDTGTNRKIADEFDIDPDTVGVEGINLPSSFQRIRGIATEPQSFKDSQFLFIPYGILSGGGDIGVFDIRVGRQTTYSTVANSLISSHSGFTLTGRPLDIKMKWTTDSPPKLLAFLTTDENNLVSDVEGPFSGGSGGGGSSSAAMGGPPQCEGDECGGGGGSPPPTRTLRLTIVDVTPDLTDPNNPTFNGTIVGGAILSSTVFSESTEPQLQEMGMDFNADKSKIYLANPDTNQVQVVDTSNFLITNSILVGTKPVDVDIEDIPGRGERAYVVNSKSENISIINVSTNIVDGTIGLGAGTSPTSVALRSDGRFGFTTNFGDNSLTMIDLQTQVITLIITLPAGATNPRRLVVQSTQ